MPARYRASEGSCEFARPPSGGPTHRQRSTVRSSTSSAGTAASASTVAGHRSGRSVLYLRTVLAEALVAAAR
ncbi:hypothetical protein P3T37_001939 [Kitasatospora sp. MAA4]|uniref:hypothetical protein n=1 Tax=Kitasatospora sp. MAA4 TaxID=3035093 RepID=UPI002474D537|nr:hypothetical protein [Kitasatospora sp. MAA4]MDH6132554.1 hypothetical protein [Kitasatospora sp. MAA4]